MHVCRLFLGVCVCVHSSSCRALVSFLLRGDDVFSEQRHIFMIMDLATGGELFNLVTKNPGDCASEADIRWMITNMLSAVSQRRLVSGIQPLCLHSLSLDFSFSSSGLRTLTEVHATVFPSSGSPGGHWKKVSRVYGRCTSDMRPHGREMRPVRSCTPNPIRFISSRGIR